MQTQPQQPSEDVISAVIGDISIDAGMIVEGTDQKKAPTFDVAAYNGGPLSLPNFDLPVVVDLSTLRFTENIVAHLDHDRSKRAGHAIAKRNDGKTLGLSGVLWPAELPAQQIVNASETGFKWQASIEAVKDGGTVERVQTGKQVSVNGQTFKGPIFVARDFILTGFSFVPHGADATTHARIAAEAANFNPKDGSMPTTLEIDAQSTENLSLEQVIDAGKRDRDRESVIARLTMEALQSHPSRLTEIEAMSRLAVQQKWAPEKYELELLRANRPQAHTTGRSHRGMEAKVIEAALAKSCNLENIEAHYDQQTLDAADKQFRRGIGLQEAMLLAARENGCHAVGVSDYENVFRHAFDKNYIRASGFSTFSLPGILSNVTNKMLRQAYDAVEAEWRKIAAIGSNKDFKTSTEYALTGDMQFEEVGPTGELKHATVGEETYTNRLKTFGRLFVISRQDWINDDLGALDRVRQKLGRGGALALNDDFWSVFLNNATFFTSARGNFDDGSDTEFSADALTAADLLFRTQTDPNGKPLGSMPRKLVVPPAYRIPAQRLMSSQQLLSASDKGSDNPWAGAFDVVSSVYMSNSSYTGSSSKKWYLLADSADIPVIQVKFLNGVQFPTVETADADFNQLGLQLRSFWDFGVSLQNYRGGVAMKGEA